MSCTVWILWLLFCPTVWAVEMPRPDQVDVSQLTQELKAEVPMLEGLAEDQPRQRLDIRRLSGDFTPQEMTKIRSVLSSHVPRPPVNPDSELLTAIEQATTLQELKDALLGRTRPGRVHGRKP